MHSNKQFTVMLHLFPINVTNEANITTLDRYNSLGDRPSSRSNLMIIVQVMWLCVTEVRSVSARLFAGTWRPLASVFTTLYYVVIIFHRRAWYRALSLRYVCIRRSGIILIPWATFVPNFVSFAASIAELAHGGKSPTQSLTRPAYLMPREPMHLRFGNRNK